MTRAECIRRAAARAELSKHEPGSNEHDLIVLRLARQFAVQPGEVLRSIGRRRRPPRRHRRLLIQF